MKTGDEHPHPLEHFMDFKTLECLYINDNSVVTCNLGHEIADEADFLGNMAHARRNTLEEFLTLWLTHMMDHHREVVRGPLRRYVRDLSIATATVQFMGWLNDE